MKRQLDDLREDKDKLMAEASEELAKTIRQRDKLEEEKGKESWYSKDRVERQMQLSQNELDRRAVMNRTPDELLTEMVKRLWKYLSQELTERVPTLEEVLQGTMEENPPAKVVADGTRKSLRASTPTSRFADETVAGGSDGKAQVKEKAKKRKSGAAEEDKPVKGAKALSSKKGKEHDVTSLSLKQRDEDPETRSTALARLQKSSSSQSTEGESGGKKRGSGDFKSLGNKNTREEKAEGEIAVDGEEEKTESVETEGELAAEQEEEKSEEMEEGQEEDA
jgi:hypothetical protein